MKPDWVQMSEYMQQLRQLARRAARLWMAEEPVTPLGLSRSMGLQQVNVSRLIRGLRARALVAAAPSPTDRRSYTLSLTQAGRQALQDGCRAYLSPLYRMREGLGEA